MGEVPGTPPCDSASLLGSDSCPGPLRTPPAAGAARSSFHKCPLQSLPWQLLRPMTHTHFRECPCSSDCPVLGTTVEGTYTLPFLGQRVGLLGYPSL